MSKLWVWAVGALAVRVQGCRRLGCQSMGSDVLGVGTLGAYVLVFRVLESWSSGCQRNTYACTHMHTHTHASVQARTHTRTHAHTHTHARTHTRTHARMPYIYINVLSTHRYRMSVFQPHTVNSGRWHVSSD